MWLPARGAAALAAGALILASCSSSHLGTRAARAASLAPRAPSVPPRAPSTSISTTTTTAAASTTTTTPPTSAPTKSGAPSLAPPSPATGLVLSPVSGPQGTVVSLRAGGCSPPAGGYSGFFADSAALAHPDQPSYRHPVTLSPAGADSAAGTYRIGPTDTTGRGLFEVLCAGAGNATAAFTVTS